ncbi:flagellar protein FlaG [Thermosyntropha sp.]|uniref:flagellar protein FlaG n=1 Tax=Thermosyntropha sp. TaxID=2740820 RepID=UPI0025E10177|nr:flagellar protein FlaG [Thermosyntropha sp.]MBO8159033.1 flagellar protein FlaG [Thermosyntropha sp.]
MRIEGLAAAGNYPRNVRTDFANREVFSAGMAEQKESKLKDGEEKGLKETMPPALERLQQAVETANEAFHISNYHLEFQIHEKSGKYQIKVVDTDSNKVIREIPPEYMLEISASIKEVLDRFLGVFVDALV